MADYSKKFIALDLETTHLDTAEGRIMEAAGVEVEIYFDETERKVKARFGREFSSLINPEIEVPPLGLLLTGIELEELRKAPVWSAVKPKLYNFLKDNVLLGHNIAFDLDFLLAQGMKLGNESLDTLELSQTLLPMSDSHSLEYLAEHHGVSGGRAHRALADSRSAALVLAAALNEFLALSLPLQNQIRELLTDNPVAFRDLILDLPRIQNTESTRLPARQGRQKTNAVPTAALKLPFTWQDKTIYSLPVSFDRQQEWLAALAREKQSALVGVSHPLYLDFVPQRQTLIHPIWALCPVRLQRALNREPKTPASVRLLIKILIVRQISSPVDLSGVKFTAYERLLLSALKVDPQICRSHKCDYVKSLKLEKNQVYFADLRTLFTLILEWEEEFSQYSLLLFDLAQIENSLSAGLSTSWNLRKVRARLNQIYPVETESLSIYSRRPKELELLLNELDLFFGILHLVYLKRENDFAQNLVIDEEEDGKERFRKLIRPAEKFIAKLKQFIQYVESRRVLANKEQQVELVALQNQLDRLTGFLQKFFLDRYQQEEIYWLKFNAEWVDLNHAPKELAATWAAFSQKFRRLSIVDTQLPQLSWAYYEKRLGLGAYGHKRLFQSDDKQLIVNLYSQDQAPEELVKQLVKPDDSVIVVLPNETQLEKFYLRLKPEVRLADRMVAYKFSGALPKVRQRLKQRPFIFLLTTNALLRDFAFLPPAEHLVIARLPFEPPGTRPALGSPSFFEATLPRAIHLLHSMLSRFAEPEERTGKTVYLLDPRITTAYDRAVYKYLEEFPEFRIIHN